MATLQLCCVMSEEEKTQRNRSRAIDRQLEKEKHQYRRTIKLLLLGSGESGKSTFLKQMRIINGKDFSPEEIEQFRSIIYNNIVKGMKVLIDARDKLRIEWGNERSSVDARNIFNNDNNVILDPILFSSLAPALQRLWLDRGILEAFDRRREFQLGDSLKYFLDNIERIGSKDYRPIHLDILHSRKATKGITEHDFTIKTVPFRFVDVGGQRSQRQKWYQCFENVTSILFIVAGNEFDQVLFEDRRMNRLMESCNIFETIVNNTAFSRVSVILLINKTDLLAEKIKHVNIGDYIEQFCGNWQDLAVVQEFLLSLFDSRRRDRSRPLFHHFTTAVDTENIRFVFQAVKNTILQNHLENVGLQ